MRRLLWALGMAVLIVAVYFVLTGALIGVHNATGLPVRNYHSGDFTRHRIEYLFVWPTLLALLAGILTWLAYGWQHVRDAENDGDDENHGEDAE